MDKKGFGKGLRKVYWFQWFHTISHLSTVCGLYA